MRRTLFKGLAIGTSIFISLLGIAFLGFSPAFELALLFSLPVIYIVGPLFDLLASESLDGPPGGVAIVLISAWVELCLISAFFSAAFYQWRSNPSFKRDALKRAP